MAALEWTHEKCGRPGCTGTTECEAFPTVADRVAMVGAAYNAYAESDGTALLDFVQDVMLLAIARGVEPDTLRQLITMHERRPNDL